MKKLHLLKTILLLCALIAGSNSLWADTTFQRITSTSDLEAGSRYIIVYESRNVAMGVISDNKGTEVSVSISSNTITLGSSTTVNILTLGGTTGAYTLLGSQDSKYIGGSSSNTNLLSNSSVQNDSYRWSITFNGNNAVINNKSATTRYIKHNGSSDWRHYTSANGNAIQLYKEQASVDPRTAVNISAFSANKTTLIVGEEVATSVTNDQSGWTASYTYSSSKSSVATVSSTGVITAVSKGTADITVTPNINPSDESYRVGATRYVTITVQNPSHSASFYFNGSLLSDESIQEGDAIEFPAVPDEYRGKVFMGWKEGSAIDGTTDIAPSLVGSATMGDADIDYYAVYASAEGEETSAELTSTELKSNITNEQCSYGTEKSWTDGNVTWVGCGTTDAASRPWLQMRKKNDSYFKITAPKAITRITVTISSNSNSAGGITDISKHTAYTGGICLETSAKSTPTGERGYSNVVTSNTMKVRAKGTDKTLYLQTDAGARIWDMSIKYGDLSYTKYCTTIPAEPADPVVSGSTVTLTTTSNMAGWRTYNNNTANKYTVDGTTKVYYAPSAGDNKVNLAEITGGVPANTAVILHQTDGSNEMILSLDNDAVITGAPSSAAENELKVSTEGQNLGKVYRLGYKASDGVGFYTYTTASAPAGIIYVSSVSSANFLSFDFGDVTGIESLTPDPSPKGEGSEYFNLNGQRVAQPTKGLYIVNGRKVIVP